MAIRINSGIVREPLINELDKQIGEVIYNPHDIGVITRFNAQKEFLGAMDQKQKTAEEATEESALQIILEITEDLKIVFDSIFLPGFFDAAFSQIHPCTRLENGEMFCMVVAKSVVQSIADTVAKDAEESEARKAKYLNGYD